MTDRKYDPKRESRDWYFVEYHPPSGSKFANLYLTAVTDDAPKRDVIAAMEAEAITWLKLYPVPILVFAFDNKERLYKFDELKVGDSLLGFVDKDRAICLRWELRDDKEIPDTALNQEYINNLYANFSFVDNDEYDKARRKRRMRIQIGLELFAFLPFVVVLAYETFVYFNDLLSLTAFFYIVFKSIQKALKLLNFWPKSKREKEREREESLKEHYYHYCKMNPEGFEKLKLECLEKMAKDKVKKEFELLNLNP